MVIHFNTTILFGNASENLTKEWEERALLLLRRAYQDVSFLHLHLRKTGVTSMRE